MSRTTKQSLTDAEKAKLQPLLSALDVFRGERGTMPIHHIAAFLLVAMDEGEGPTEYGKRAGLAQPVMSRTLLDLGDQARRGDGSGLGLLRQRRSLEHAGVNEAYLSPAGQGLAHKVLRALEARK